MYIVAQQDISCLIVTGDGEIPANVLELAEEKNLLVVSSPYENILVLDW